jgi:hypothetical protein
VPPYTQAEASLFGANCEIITGLRWGTYKAVDDVAGIMEWVPPRGAAEAGLDDQVVRDDVDHQADAPGQQR